MPSVAEVRTRIEKTEDPIVQHALMYQYLICGRISEVAGKYRPFGDDAQVVEFGVVEAVLFPVQTAKRGGKLRPVALPLNADYEPWARPLLYWFQDRLGEEAFPTSIRTIHRRAREAFEGLMYPIEEYNKFVKKVVAGEEVNVVIPVEGHWRPMATHALRHIRALQDLMVFYEFGGLDIAIYGGWSSKAVEQQLPTIVRRYLHMTPNEMNVGLLKILASRYFSKLLRKRA